MKKQTSKKESANISSNDRMEILLEDMSDQIKIVAEGVSTVNSKVDRVAEDLTDFKSETEANFKLVLGHLSLLEDELAEFRKDLEKLKKENEKKIDKKEFNFLERRLSRLEIRFEKIATENKKIKQLIK